jgi:hypothetical protein
MNIHDFISLDIENHVHLLTGRGWGSKIAGITREA